MASFLNGIRSEGKLKLRSILSEAMEVKERTTTKKNYGEHELFFTEMRFWLILLMLAAFLGFLLFLS